MEDVYRLGRYLLGRPSLALRYERQRVPDSIRVSGDRDFASDRTTRKSTTGRVHRLERHGTNEREDGDIVELNINECDFCTVVHEAHFQTRYLWIQDMIAANSFVIRKLPTTSNVSAILAKARDRKTLDKDLSTMGFVEVPASKMHKQS